MNKIFRLAVGLASILSTKLEREWELYFDDASGRNPGKAYIEVHLSEPKCWINMQANIGMRRDMD